MVLHHGGGILGALDILRDHWSAVTRDLVVSGKHMSDWCTERLQFHELFAFINYAPPGTATFHVLNEGWTADTHQLTNLLDVANWLLWSKTKDAQEKHPQHKPERSPRPGYQAPLDEEAPHMTVEDYMKIMEGGT